MGRLRVHELAKELGTTSKNLLEVLREQGEFVKSASSTIEAPVVRRVRESFPKAEAKESKPRATKTTAGKAGGSEKGTPGPRPKAPAKTTKKAEATAGKPAPKPAGEKAKVNAGATEDVPVGEKPSRIAKATPKAAPKATPKAAPKAKENTPKPGGEKPVFRQAKEAPQATQAPTRPGPKPGAPRGQAARPGNNPFATQQGMPRPGGTGGPRPGPRPGPRSGAGGGGRNPRPGNNPFATQQGMPRQGGAQGAGQGNQGGGPRPGGSRPGPRQGGQGRPGGGPRGAGGGPRQGGGSRPSPSMMPGTSTFTRPGGGSGGPGPRGGAPKGGSRPGFGSPSAGAGNAGAAGGPGNTGGAPAGRGGFAGRGGRGGGRGGTQGAFGRAGGRPVKGRKSKRAKRQEFEQQSAPMIGGVQIPRGDGNTEVKIRSGASLADLADKINVNPAALVTVLFHLGEMATATQSLDEDTFAMLGAELGYQVKVVSPEDEERELLESFDINLEAEELTDAQNLVPRPPVVTVMGHVDHGKTKLLDAIRHSDVVAGEHGGITQQIGAYQVHVAAKGAEEVADRHITFIDTPGHEAFTAMRARGAEVTDLAILVVAADDGVMPQTVEAINHAQAAKVPIVVAVNKIDKDGANPGKIRGQLADYGVVAEEYGGEVMFIDVSAKQRTGIQELLEAVLLTADASLDLQANPDADARGVAIEANLDKGRGAVTTVLVERGTLRVGDAIVAGTAYGRVRAMFDEHGEPVIGAAPARPVQVLGLTSVPRAGDSFLVAPDDRTARQIADKREAAERAAMLAKRRKRITLEDFNKALEEGKVETLNLILKGDGSGAVEALEDSLLKIDVGEEVALRIIHRGVGAITQNDVNLATVDNAIIIGFNVRTAEKVSEYADREGVEVKYYSVIYKAIEDIENAMKGMLKPIYEEVELGSAEIRQVFKSSKFGNIAGCIIRSGTIKRGTKARLIRDGVVITENLEIQSLRREKDDVTEVREGYECGISLGQKDISEGDIIETWEMREKPRD